MLPSTQAQWRRAPDGARLELRRRLRHPIEKVWAAIATPERLAAWMGVEWLGAAGPLREGAAFDYRFANTELESRGHVLVFEPPRVLEHSWYENIPPAAIVRWSLEPDAEGCILTLIHRAGPPEDGPRTAAGWTHLIESLAASLGETNTAGGGIEAWRALRDRYAADFPPDASRDGRRVTVDGDQALRFERRLAKTPATVWAALVEPDALGRWLQAREAIVEPWVGGKFHLVLGGGSSRMQGQVLAWDPPARLEYSWPEAQANGDSIVRFEIYEEAAGSRLVLTHILRQGGEAADFASGWHWHLDALELALDGARVDFDRPRWAALKRAYEATF